MFAHGWHHGAQVCDSNLACFRRVLHDFKSRYSDREIVGIYLGWRGESFRKGRSLTLWSRKNIAQRIGREGALTSLLAIDEIAQQKGLRLVTVGHSLGAALIFTAVQHKFITEVAGSRQVRPIGKSDRIVRGFGDMVVLVNPAIEAWEYEPFYQDTRQRVGRPEIITIATSADAAVGKAFPASRVVQYLWKPGNIKKGGSNLSGMGRYESHVTHTISYEGIDKRSPPEEESTGSSVGTCGCNMTIGDAVDEDAYLVELNTQNSDQANSEFLVYRTDETVMRGHNDIFNNVFINFLGKIIDGDEEDMKTFGIEVYGRSGPL